jgi:hypothetical protein
MPTTESMGPEGPFYLRDWLASLEPTEAKCDRCGDTEGRTS